MKNIIIGITPLVDVEKDSYWMLPGYLEMIQKVNAIPIILPLTSNTDFIDDIITMCDGFLFTGGQDINPILYKEKPFPSTIYNNDRDNMESILFNKLLKTNKPILGICRGIQLFNVLLGGTLYQDLPSQLNINHKQNPPYDKNFHNVNILKNTPLFNLINKDNIGVNSYHHQGIKKLSHRLKPMAINQDNIIEAVYMPEKKFVWAVQWHPEFNYKKEKTSLKIINEFISNCKKGVE